MADSYNFNFKITDRFWLDFNKKFNVANINNENYKLVLLSSMTTDFSSIVNTTGSNLGYLKDLSGVTGVEVLEQPTLTTFKLTSQMTGVGFAIMVSQSVDIEFDDSSNNYVQAILLVKHESNQSANEGYVLAWAKASNPIRVKDALTIPLNSEICGVGNCSG